ncbi:MULTISPECIES: hypothetical protein [unclassified Streptomyces]|uniref:hypothetical protein n=1 Tax=unclassified Streptomyces TaxID=2593676 RepID=UPI002DD9FAF6|nr:MULTISPECIES: hypothetical protein [unclassified Streptomyces]WSC48955.1 hypothetical protein OIE61_36200 [Streptomyces sp. NBC_01762]WSJ49385.1 hypothetical protein OG243_07380 [Streptomyces sp. NBC_01318]
MSDYYDLFLAVDMPPDLPEPVLQELSWLLGQANMPTDLKSTDWESWGGPWQAFDGGSASHSFDGADVSLLVRATNRPNLDGSEPWALTVRTCVHEDDFGVTMDVVGWLLRHAITQGWVGFVRDSALGQVQHLVRHEDGFDLVDVRPAGQPKRVPWSSR